MTGLYERYRNGAPYYDALTGAQTECANVIVLRTDVSWYNNAPQRPVIQLVGQGVAEICRMASTSAARGCAPMTARPATTRSPSLPA